MLPFSVKVLWFALCLSGTVCSCFVLYAFARCTGSWWGPMIYLAAFFVLEGVYCLGMIWHMDPFLMPTSFCWAQITLMNYSSFVLTGVCACFTYATTVAVIFPAQADTSPYSTLQFRNRYYFPLAVFPIVATSILMGVVVKYDAAKPSDGTHCDITDPIWIRFLGYGAMGFCETLPCLALALVAGFRITRMHRAHQRSWLAARQQLYSGDKERNLAELTVRSKHHLDHVSTPVSVIPSSVYPKVVVKQPNTPRSGPAPLHVEVQKRSFHLQSPETVEPHTSVSPDEYYTPPSPASSTFPTFSRLTDAETASLDSVAPGESRHRNALRETVSEGDAASSIQWQKDNAPMQQEVASDIDEGEYGAPRQSQPSARWYKEMSFRSQEQPPGMPGALVSAIWRLILFQSAFIGVQTLLSISTLVDVIRGNESNPMPFGSQHVALMFSAWGPTVVFSHAPAVRAQVKGWFQFR